jgi:hypothetical protein
MQSEIRKSSARQMRIEMAFDVRSPPSRLLTDLGELDDGDPARVNGRDRIPV